MKIKVVLLVALIAILNLGTGFSAYLLSRPSPAKPARKPLKLEVEIISVVPTNQSFDFLNESVAVYTLYNGSWYLMNQPYTYNSYNVTVLNLGDPCNVTVFGEARPQMYGLSNAKLDLGSVQNVTVEKLIHLEPNEQKIVVFKFDVGCPLNEVQFWTAFQIEQ
jgi:hypothetical protein